MLTSSHLKNSKKNKGAYLLKLSCTEQNRNVLKMDPAIKCRMGALFVKIVTKNGIIFHYQMKTFIKIEN